MKTKEEIIEEMKTDSHWKVPEKNGLGIYGNDIVKKEQEKFDREVERRIKIQKGKLSRELKNNYKNNNQIFFVIDYLNDRRKEFYEHYQEDIHGKENWKSFENMEKVDFVLKMLYKLSEELTNDHRDIQKEIEKKSDESIFISII